MIQIKRIQIFSESIALPLKLLFEIALKDKKFPDIWKIANAVPVQAVYLLSSAKYLKE